MIPTPPLDLLIARVAALEQIVNTLDTALKQQAELARLSFRRTEYGTLERLNPRDVDPRD